jgi:hemerythrin-like domain-containing protein
VSKAIQDLRDEHKAIQTGLGILTAMTAKFGHSKALNVADTREFLGFLKEFADKCHHGKEEGILFPALVEAGMSDKTGPIAVMLAEHARGRELIREMEAAAADPPDLARFTHAARAYSSLLTAHIQKENDVLFPAAQKALSADKLHSIFDRFEAHEEQVIGHGRHEQLHALLHRLAEQYEG